MFLVDLSCTQKKEIFDKQQLCYLENKKYDTTVYTSRMVGSIAHYELLFIT